MEIVFFRTLSHIIFGNESEHHNVRGSLIDTFKQSPYVAALCSIQGYNEISIQQHFTCMKFNYSWATVNELVMLGIIARINVSYINVADKDPSIWVITDGIHTIRDITIRDITFRDITIRDITEYFFIMLLLYCICILL